MEERWPYCIPMTMQRHTGSRCAPARAPRAVVTSETDVIANSATLLQTEPAVLAPHSRPAEPDAGK